MPALDNLHSLRLLLPESLLAVAALALLVVDLVAAKPCRRRSGAIACVALVSATALSSVDYGSRALLFGGLLCKDGALDFFRVLCFSATTLVCLASMAPWQSSARANEQTNRDSAEYFALLLGVAVGMPLMASASDLLTAFLALETVSMLCYLLVAFGPGDPRSAEAALKYAIYGGAAAGIMLFGMSLLYGLSGSTAFSEIHAHAGGAPPIALAAAVTFCLAGFGYKIAAVPFHMWCPDAYEGAPTPVAAFLSIGPKAAGFALLIRFLQTALPPDSRAGAGLLGLLAAASMTLGNLAALSQQNVKRLLAWSSIAHAGYLLLGLVAQNQAGLRALVFYLIVYLFMTLGAFFVVVAASAAGAGETLADWRGLGQRAPLLAACMAIFLFSFTGIPPLAGFVGKFGLFSALIERGGPLCLSLAVLGIVNSVVSFYYYARIAATMYFEPPTDASPLPVARLHLGLVLGCAVATALLGVGAAPLLHVAATVF